MKKYMYRMANHNRKGFSLVELVVVILIIAILAAAIFLGGATVIKQSRESALRNDLRNYGTYVQDMLYANPDLQANSGAYNVQEGFTYVPSTQLFKAGTADSADGLSAALLPTAGAKADAIGTTLATLKVLPKLNKDYLTADFQLNGSKVDPWDNAYCYSYDMSPSTGTGDPASCIIVINSLGVNSLDETSDGSATPANTKGVAANVISKLGSEGYMSATDVVNSEEVKSKTADDYGVVVVMIGGQVSTAYYGFN